MSTTSSLTLTQKLINFIAPRECFACGVIGTWLCENCTKNVPLLSPPPCPVCRKKTLAGKIHVPSCQKQLLLNGCLPATNLTHPSIKYLIYGLKYHGLKSASLPLANLMAKTIEQHPIISSTKKSRCVICPIPLHQKRLRERGFDQAQLLASKVSSILGIPILNLLVRTRLTKDQIRLTRSKRRINLNNAFQANPSLSTSLPSLIILIDDVVTTGATFNSAAQAILEKSKNTLIWASAAAYHDSINN